ncbi:hypothetical protein D3C79_652180 [compost metagenome]
MRLHQTFVVGLGNLRISFGQDHLQHVDAGTEERPLLTHLRQQLTLPPCQCIAQRSLPPQPGRQHQARLGPAEDPWNGTQAFDATGTTLGRAAAQWQAPQFLLRRRLAEVLDEIRVLPHHAAVSLDAIGGQLVHQGAPGRLRGWRRQQGGFQHRRQVQVEVLLGDTWQTKLEADHLALLGGAKPPCH